MKITDEIKAELEKKGFLEFRVNGIQRFVSSEIREGFEVKNNHFNPFRVIEDDTEYNPVELNEKTQDAMTIIENMQLETAVEPKAEVQKYIPETAIVPDNLTKELIAKHPGTIEVLLSMQQTAAQYIKVQKDMQGNVRMVNGKPLSFVEGSYMKRCLNYACLFDWNFDVIESREDLIGDKTHFSVCGKLTIRTTEGKTISKTQWGSQVLKAKQEVGDALKGATTDALKKCAADLGIAADVYSGEC